MSRLGSKLEKKHFIQFRPFEALFWVFNKNVQKQQICKPWMYKTLKSKYIYIYVCVQTGLKTILTFLLVYFTYRFGLQSAPGIL